MAWTADRRAKCPESLALRNALNALTPSERDGLTFAVAAPFLRRKCMAKTFAIAAISSPRTVVTWYSTRRVRDGVWANLRPNDSIEGEA